MAIVLIGLEYLRYSLAAFFSSLIKAAFLRAVSFFGIFNVRLIHCLPRKMMYVSVIGEDRMVKTFGSDDIQYLVNITIAGMPVGYNYRIVSKDQIMRLEVLSPDPFVAIWTNLDNKRHSWVIRKVLDQMDLDMANLEETDDDTELE